MSPTKFINTGGLPMGEVPAGPFWIEYQDSLESPEAKKVPTFALTSDELVALVKHHYSEIPEIEWLSLFAWSSAWQLEGDFAFCRIARFQTVLGEEAVDQAKNEAREEFLQGLKDPEARRIFTEGERWGKKAFAEKWSKRIDAEQRAECDETQSD